MSPIAGFTRLRKHQVGPHTSFGSNAVATRILPYTGSIVVEPNRAVPDVDTGSLDPLLSMYAGALDITGTLDGKARYDDLPYLYGPLFKGSVVPTSSSGAYTWTYQAASLTADDYDYIVHEYGDDASDVITGYAGIVDTATVAMPEDLGPLDLSFGTVYARASLSTPFTAGLSVADSPYVYGKDTVVYMDSAAGSIGITPIADAVHSFSWALTGNNDRKRFANGSNSGFNLAGYGRGPREVEFTLTVAKTAATIAEAQTLDDTPCPTRFFDLKTTSTETIAASGTPYSHSLRFAAQLVARAETEVGNNSAIQLTYRVRYNATLGYAIRAVVVNGLASR